MRQRLKAHLGCEQRLINVHGGSEECRRRGGYMYRWGHEQRIGRVPLVLEHHQVRVEYDGIEDM